MITLSHKWARGSNSIALKWVFRWEWEEWHWNCFPPQWICLAAILAWYCRATARQYNQAIASLFGKQFTRCDPGGVAWYELMKIICLMGLKDAWGLGLGMAWAILSGWSPRPKWVWISQGRTILYLSLSLLNIGKLGWVRRICKSYDLNPTRPIVKKYFITQPTNP